MSQTCVSRIKFTCLLVAAMIVMPAVHANEVYSGGGWATLHRDAANRKLAPEAVLFPEYHSWHALAGATVLTAPTMSPDGRTFYVTTGRARGHSNLHAFSLSGDLIWESEPWQTAEEGVDACAVLSSPIVDIAGDIYLGDCNQLFAFRPDGVVKWVVPLPPSREGDWVAAADLPVNALTTAVFTADGHVLGVTNFGDVLVVDRLSGDVLNSPWRLPGLLPPSSDAVPLPTSMFAGGLLDPGLREWAWQLLFGGNMRSANTPAVALESGGRVFVAATSVNAGQGALYALDLKTDPEGVHIGLGFATDMGPGSGSSPALSLSENVVYVSDEDGLFYAVNARSGEIAWQVQTRVGAAAAAVGADGTVYALQVQAPALVAISPEGGIRWQSALDDLARKTLPSSWLLGDPVAVGNGNPTVIKGSVLVPVLYGYEISLGKSILLPVMSSVVALDLETGEGLRNVLTLKDDSAGVTAVLPDGTIINSLGAMSSSALGELAPFVNWLLPDDYRLIAPLGGVQVSMPVSLSE
ncbi:MAG: PQQ-binding-like beta-propeller repeat protein [Halioglobus sp.]